jgi:hypothetical protein
LLDLIELGFQSVNVTFLVLQDGIKQFAASIVRCLYASPDAFVIGFCGRHFRSVIVFMYGHYCPVVFA